MSFFSISESTSYTTNNSMSYLHSHEYFEIYLQISGRRMYFCDDKSYTLEENMLIVTRPNVLHMFGGGTSTRYLLSIDESFFSENQIQFLNDLSEKTLISIDPAHIHELIDTLTKLKEIEQSVANNKNVSIALLLGLLLYQIQTYQMGAVNASFSLIKGTVSNYVSPTILKIMDYIQKHYQEKISLTDLCQQFNLSKTWLCKCFLKASGMTIFDYKIMLQLDAAKKLLKGTKLSIDKISKSVGFSSSRHFSLTFKKHTSITPLRWRKSFRTIESTSLKKSKK